MLYGLLATSLPLTKDYFIIIMQLGYVDIMHAERLSTMPKMNHVLHFAFSGHPRPWSIQGR